MSQDYYQSAPPSGRWVERTQQGPQPSAMDMRVRDASQVQHRAVAFSQQAMQVVRNLANNPGDFLLSTAASMATFMAVKSVVIVGATTVGLSFLAGPIAAAMVAAGVIGMWRANSEASKIKQQRVAALQASGAPPTAADLAAAQHVDSGAIVNSGIRHALISGILGSLIGFMIDPEMPTQGPTQEEFNAFKQDIMDNYPDKQEPNFVSAEGELGVYGFDEKTLVEQGYYTADDTPDVNDWTGTWTGESIVIDGKEVEVASKEVLLQNEAMQHAIYSDVLDTRLDESWKQIHETEALHKFIGQEVNGQTITKDQLLAGVERFGAGEVGEDGCGIGGMTEYLTYENLEDAELMEEMKAYLGEFGEHENLPYSMESPDRMEFAAAPAESKSFFQPFIDLFTGAGTAAVADGVVDFSSPEWKNYLEKLPEPFQYHDKHDFQMDSGEIGGYRLSEQDLSRLGYYEDVSNTPNVNEWEGNWGNKDVMVNGESIGKIDGLETLKQSPEIQEQLAKELQALEQYEHWKEIQATPEYAEYIGKEIAGVKIEEVHLLAGYEKWGYGFFEESGYGFQGLPHQLNPDPGAGYGRYEDFAEYMHQFDGMAMPFDVNNAEHLGAVQDSTAQDTPTYRFSWANGEELVIPTDQAVQDSVSRNLEHSSLMEHFGKSHEDALKWHFQYADPYQNLEPEVKAQYLRDVLPQVQDMNPAQVDTFLKEYDAKVMEGPLSTIDPDNFDRPARENLGPNTERLMQQDSVQQDTTQKKKFHISDVPIMQRGG